MDSKKITVVSIVVFVLSLLVFASTVFLVVFKQPATSVGGSGRGNSLTVEIGDVSTQVGSSGRYFKGYVYVDVSGKETSKKVEELMPKIKDKLLSTISYASPSDITDEKKFDALKQEICTNLNGILGEGSVLNVYFSEKILQ